MIKYFIGFLIITVVLYITKIGCPIKFITGISCPGCGLTRAWVSLFQLRIADAFYYHPLFWLVPVFVVMYMYEKKLPKKLLNIVSLAGILAYVVVYILRMCIFKNDIVVFEPELGLFKKLVDHF